MSSSYYLKKLNKESIKETFNYDLDEFNIEKLIDKETLIELGLKYCIVYNYDGVVTELISKVDLDIENIIEARFFNDEYEIRIFNDEGNVSGTIFKEMTKSKKISNNYILYPRYGEKRKGKRYAYELTVTKYVNYDDDNQAYIDYVKPSELKFTGGDN